jgi:hypothetical protein
VPGSIDRVTGRRGPTVACPTAVIVMAVVTWAWRGSLIVGAAIGGIKVLSCRSVHPAEVVVWWVR